METFGRSKTYYIEGVEGSAFEMLRHPKGEENTKYFLDSLLFAL